MARNAEDGERHRIGAIKDRVQVYNPQNDRWVKVDKSTGRFMDQKSDGSPFVGVTKK